MEGIAVKKGAICLICLLLILSLAACSQSNELPTDIKDVGDNISIKDDTLKTTTPTPKNGGMFPGTNANVTPQENDEITVDDIKAWYADFISSDFEEYTDGSIEESDAHHIEIAALRSGGDILISSYDGVYYNTIFRFSKDMDAKLRKQQIEENISIYLARDLTDYEKIVLNDAVEAIMKGGEIIYLNNFKDYIRGYIYADSNYIYVQVL